MSAPRTQTVSRSTPARRSRLRRWAVRITASLGVLLALLATLPRLIHSGPGVAALSAVAADLFRVWMVAVILVGLVLLWRRITYRVGVRLFISYLLIGLVPFVLFALFLMLAGYLLVGQYTSVRFGQEEADLEQQLRRQARMGLEKQDAGAVEEFAPSIDAGPGGVTLQPLWLVEDGTGRWHSEGAADIPTPAWSERDAEWSGMVVADSMPHLAAVAMADDRLAAVLVPLNLETSRAVSRDRWFALRFTLGGPDAADSPEPSGTIVVDLGAQRADGATVRVDGGIPGPEFVEPDWFVFRRGDERWYRRRFVVWFRLSPPPRLWEDGSTDSARSVVTLLRTSPAEAWSDFLASPYEVAGGVTSALVGVGTVFGVIYLIAVSMAALLIVRVARSTSRLSRGAREVAAGNLKVRIPVRRRDQLGDLAESFNQMAGAIESMLAEVSEKERLAREVELAREIQESLLPSPEFVHGELEVVAAFRPAAEVGGDLFDLFPGDEGRLTVVVGDVAGHGLSTGLLMAMVKAGVTALIQEGRRGPELAAGLNRMLMQQPLRRRMVTMALAEIDPVADTLEVTSAGHPPAFVIDREGVVEELLLPSLPLGRSWGGRHPQRTVRFYSGSAVVFYSDGLVEACDPTGEEFGFQRLQELLNRLAGRSSRKLLDGLLQELDRFTAGTPLPDDLTVVVVSRSGCR